MIRLVQLKHPKQGRRVAVVNESDKLQFLNTHRSIYDLAISALAARKKTLTEEINDTLSTKLLEYEPIHDGNAEWKLLPAFDHPMEPARCLVTGTGLTHRASAENRQAMHAQARIKGTVTDSMKMYQWGVEGGRPTVGKIGVQPEWFYKGSGTVLRAHGEPLEVPSYGQDGGEEAEIAGAYIIDQKGKPWRIGLTMANEFSDHKMEEKNYLYLAPSKLRTCAVGPELIVDALFEDVPGLARIERDEKIVWSHSIFTGEKNMSHTLANLEHHHFKYVPHCRPGDAHLHFFGADAFSFGDKIELRDGDIMEVAFSGFGKPLRNPIRIDRSESKFVEVKQL